MTEANGNRGEKLPVAYSCSGCSSAAQMCNYIALQLDRRKRVEMSCIAGVGGGVTSLVRKAKAAMTILALDGCPLQCVKHCLARHDLQPDLHFVLSDFKVEKKVHADFSLEEAQTLLEKIEGTLAKISIDVSASSRK